MIIKLTSLIFFWALLYAAKAQQSINILDSGNHTSLRGLSVPGDLIVWASGSNGTVVRSVNGGKTFEWLTVKGYEKRDFRDIQAFGKNTAIIIAVDEPAVILKTIDGEENWYKIFEDSTKGMFLDAMDFSDDKHGVVIGDPINKRIFIKYTKDQGEHWSSYQDNVPPETMQEGEAFFAASGTNVITFKNKGTIEFEYISGGTKSRFYSMGKAHEIPMIQGLETTGANSIAIYNKEQYVIVGGDFANDKRSDSNCILLYPGNKKWTVPQTPPHGYRSCVAYITENKLITCGTSGVDISNDGGMNWQLISTLSFHVCAKAATGNKVFLAGSNGKIALLQ
ncbi:YCF48-related protein [soil metagenome]